MYSSKRPGSKSLIRPPATDFEHIYMYMYIRISMHLCVRAGACMHIRTYVCKERSLHGHMCIHIYIRTCMERCVYLMNVSRFLRPPPMHTMHIHHACASSHLHICGAVNRDLCRHNSRCSTPPPPSAPGLSTHGVGPMYSLRSPE